MLDIQAGLALLHVHIMVIVNSEAGSAAELFRTFYSSARSRIQILRERIGAIEAQPSLEAIVHYQLARVIPLLARVGDQAERIEIRILQGSSWRDVRSPVQNHGFLRIGIVEIVQIVPSRADVIGFDHQGLGCLLLDCKRPLVAHRGLEAVFRQQRSLGI